jgi:Ala-tRNA(Pro) deacylase
MTNNGPLGPDALFTALDGLGIAHRTMRHEALFTVEQSKAVNATLPGGHTKNLFVKDKKSRHFLITMEHDAVVDLKTIHTRIGGQGRVSFGSADAMMELLGVTPGSVTLFGIINDRANALTVFIDESLLAHDEINAHPLANTATTTIATTDMLKFLAVHGHEAMILPRAAPGEDMVHSDNG